MQSRVGIERTAAELVADVDLHLVSCRPLQSLWAGYGQICHIIAAPLVKATSGENKQTSQQISFILKYITPPPGIQESIADEGHIRKLLSYQIELAFYTHLAPQLPPDVAVATCHASSASKNVSPHKLQNAGAGADSDPDFRTAMLLTDLRLAFPVAGGKRSTLTEVQVNSALKWLAGFHGFWWARMREEGGDADGLLDRDELIRPPLQHVQEHGDAIIEVKEDQRAARLWLNGGYTYLATRKTEYASLCEEESEWSDALCQPIEGTGLSMAELVAQVLAPRTQASKASTVHTGVSEYETLVHGDIKSENASFSEKGDKVAFFDFQYVGLGLGVCDLAKFFTCSVPRSMFGKNEGNRLPMGEGEERLLRVYLESVQRFSGREYCWDAFVRHWETALVDWLRFQASWGFWGNTAWLEGRVRSILADPEWIRWLHASV